MNYINRLVILAALSLAVLSLIACQQEEKTPEPEKNVGAKATAEIVGRDGQAMGVVTLSQGPQGVRW